MMLVETIVVVVVLVAVEVLKLENLFLLSMIVFQNYYNKIVVVVVDENLAYIV